MVEERHEPIVDRKSFDIVQDKLKSRQRSRQTGGNQPVCGASQMWRVWEITDYPLHQRQAPEADLFL